MSRIVQLNIFNECEEVTPQASDSYENFVKKFEYKKTSDDCYTPPAIFDAVKEHVNEYYCNLQNYNILRPFKPGGDYLKEKYTKNTLVLDNPPFSLYSKIVKNYIQMNVKFFLFAPALTLFLNNVDVNYIITNTNIIYENGAKIKTSFCTNLPTGGRVVLDGVLAEKIKAAELKKNVPAKMQKPAGIYSAADLLKYVRTGDRLILEGSQTYIKKINDKKIFGLGLQFTDDDTKKLIMLENEQNE